VFVLSFVVSEDVYVKYYESDTVKYYDIVFF